MRWSSCEARATPRGGSGAPASVARARLARIARLGILTTGIACVTTTTRYYLPDARNPRFDAERATDVLENYLRVHCPERLAAKKPGSGEVAVTVLADTSGAVTRAELTSSTGDETLDGLFGTVAAQLQVDSLRAPAVTTRRLRMAFGCSDSAAVATLQVLR